jgi:uncharacterized membrane protein
VRISKVLLIIDILNFSLTVAQVAGPTRFILGLILVIVIPGWSLVGLLKLRRAGLEFSLSMAVSLALLMIIAQILMTFHLWHLGALELVVCLLCLPSLAWQSQLLHLGGRPSR